MTTLTINLTDDRLERLQQLAQRFHVAPEELVRASIEELITRPEDDFQRMLAYVLVKNAELYRRLA
jgi:antitoxin FitA